MNGCVLGTMRRRVLLLFQDDAKVSIVVIFVSPIITLGSVVLQSVSVEARDHMSEFRVALRLHFSHLILGLMQQRRVTCQTLRRVLKKRLESHRRYGSHLFRKRSRGREARLLGPSLALILITVLKDARETSAGIFMSVNLVTLRITLLPSAISTA